MTTTKDTRPQLTGAQKDSVRSWAKTAMERQARVEAARNAYITEMARYNRVRPSSAAECLELNHHSVKHIYKLSGFVNKPFPAVGGEALESEYRKIHGISQGEDDAA